MENAPSPASGPQPTADEEPTPRPRARGIRDMVISLLVILVPLAFVVAVFRLRGGEDIVTVDPTAAIAQARATGAFPVAAPTGLPAQWRPVSARFTTGNDGSILRLGYLTPAGSAVQLIESSEPFELLRTRELGDRSVPAGMFVFDGRVWRSLGVRIDEFALVSAAPQHTMIVIGQASEAELAALAISVS